MNIQPVTIGIGYGSDIRLYKQKGGHISKRIVERFRLEEKRLMFALDKDDKDHKFIYLSIDIKGGAAESFKLKKRKTGSFQFGLSGLNVAIKHLPDEKGIGYMYNKKIAQNNLAYLQFKRINENQ